MAAPRGRLSWRTCRRYRYFFYVCLVVLFLQFYLGYKFYTINQEELKRIREWKNEMEKKLATASHTHVSVTYSNVSVAMQKSYRLEIHEQELDLSQRQTCIIQSEQAYSALKRAKTEDCKQRLTNVACLNQEKKLYPRSLPRLCPVNAKYPKGHYLGCFKDIKTDRDLGLFNTQFPEYNTPQTCIDFCLTGSYMYAGVQYKSECWCGDKFGKHKRLAEASCGSPCPGNVSQTCGGFNSQRVFSTGLPVKAAVEDEIVINPNKIKGMPLARIVFVLTVHGRAVRQVKRLISTLYHPKHYFYVHVDSRSDYMFREITKLQQILPNLRVSDERFATIWGGSSLLQAHFSFMKALLEMNDWKWDYYINLSESDYPIKDIESLTMYLTRFKGNNLLKSNGRETPTFIKKQGLDQTFYECDTHLWRLGKRELPTDIRIDGGSDWLALYRDFCQYAVFGTDALVKGLKQMYQFTLLPVESFFHTLLLNSPFCEKWINNNLHLTNWKRKQGCKCQHKAQVDWCGCSPNVLKQADFDRITLYSSIARYFARKFDPIVSQEIVNKIDALLGKDIKEMPNFNKYWQNDYHYLDERNKNSDITMTTAESLIRRMETTFLSGHERCIFHNVQILETHVLYIADEFQRYLVKFNVSIEGRGVPVTLEGEFRRKHYYRVIDPEGPIGRLQFLEVNTDWDVKEMMFRNYPMILGPHSEVLLRHIWEPGAPLNVAVAWIDPAGTLATYNNLAIANNASNEFFNPKIRTPLRPGVWTVKMIFRSKVRAETKFIVLPYSIYEGEKLTIEEVKLYHNGPEGHYFVGDLSLFASKFKIQNAEELLQTANKNGEKTGSELDDWIDKLSEKIWTMENMCSVNFFSELCPSVERCRETKWSSLSPDPKSEISKKVIKH